MRVCVTVRVRAHFQLSSDFVYDTEISIAGMTTFAAGFFNEVDATEDPAFGFVTSGGWEFATGTLTLSLLTDLEPGTPYTYTMVLQNQPSEKTAVDVTFTMQDDLISSLTTAIY